MSFQSLFSTSDKRMWGLLAAGGGLFGIIALCGFCYFSGMFSRQRADKELAELSPIGAMSKKPSEEWPAPSNVRKRRPIDPRIVGKWIMQGPAPHDWVNYTERTVVFSAGEKFSYTDTGTTNWDPFALKALDKVKKHNTSYSGQFWFLDGGRIEFLSEGRKALVMGIDWTADNEMILAALEEVEAKHRDYNLESHLKGILKRQAKESAPADSKNQPKATK